MNLSFALAAVLMMADPQPVEVFAKVLYGTGDATQQGEMEPWISKVTAQEGSPHAATYTSWIKLTRDEQQLYASMMGGRLIQGKVTQHQNGIDVHISGFKIGERERLLPLKSGERRVIKLTDYPPPGNVYLALTTSGDDRQFGEKNRPPLRANVVRDSTQVRLLAEAEGTIIDVTSPRGIDNASIEREINAWPKKLVVRLHLRGLESFRITAGETTVTWSVSSTGQFEARTSLVQDDNSTDLTKENPYYRDVQFVSRKREIPLPDGYFQIAVPEKLLEQNPESMKLEWVDFFRR